MRQISLFFPLGKCFWYYIPLYHSILIFQICCARFPFTQMFCTNFGVNSQLKRKRDIRTKNRECKRQHTQRVLIIPTLGLCRVTVSKVGYIERQFIVTFHLFCQFFWVLYLRQLLSSTCKPSMKLWIQFFRMNDLIWISYICLICTSFQSTCKSEKMQPMKFFFHKSDIVGEYLLKINNKDIRAMKMALL